MNRSRPAQRVPDPGRVTRTFPSSELGAGAALYRAVGVDPAGDPRHPGWFSADGGGRFDLRSPDGTLYAARSVHGAVMERVGLVLASAPFVPIALAESTWIWVLEPRLAMHVADLDSPRAAGHGVTCELASGNDYAIGNAWAAHFRVLGFEGVSYHGRFSTSLAEHDASVAVFGPEHVGLGPLMIRSGPVGLIHERRAARVVVARRSTRRPPPPTNDAL